MICYRCGEGILPGQPYSTHAVETGSGAAPDVHLHLKCTRPTDSPRTYPVRAR